MRRTWTFLSTSGCWSLDGRPRWQKGSGNLIIISVPAYEQMEKRGKHDFANGLGSSEISLWRQKYCTYWYFCKGKKRKHKINADKILFSYLRGRNSARVKGYLLPIFRVWLVFEGLWLLVLFCIRSFQKLSVTYRSGDYNSSFAYHAYDQKLFK